MRLLRRIYNTIKLVAELAATIYEACQFIAYSVAAAAISGVLLALVPSNDATELNAIISQIFREKGLLGSHINNVLYIKETYVLYSSSCQAWTLETRIRKM